MMASLCLALALVSDPLAGRLCGKGPTPPDGYSPPLISNGDLNMLVEWTGGQSGRAYNQMRTTVYWQGRRGPARDAELFAFGRFNPTMVVEGKAVGLPAAWSQTLDVRQALVTCVGAFAEGLEATTEVFCALDRNVVAIRRTVANTSGKPLNLTLDLAYTIEPHSRLVGAWTKQDRYFETSPYVRMRGIWEEPNTDVRARAGREDLPRLVRDLLRHLREDADGDSADRLGRPLRHAREALGRLLGRKLRAPPGREAPAHVRRAAVSPAVQRDALGLPGRHLPVPLAGEVFRLR